VVRDRRHPSGVALIIVADNGENSIAVAPGANGHLTPADVRRAARAFSSADILLIQLETPLTTVMAAAQLATQHRVPVLLNPAPAQALPDTLLKHVSILTPNETEAGLLTGIKVTNDRTAARAADKLRSRGVGTVIITLGARGAFVSNEEGGRRVPGFSVKAVDTTAAGDIFNGALAVALAGGNPLLHAVRFANAAAALSVTRIGAQPSAPTRVEIDRFLKVHNRTTRPHLSPDRGTSRPAAPPAPHGRCD
jgi:ribokinase